MSLPQPRVKIGAAFCSFGGVDFKRIKDLNDRNESYYCKIGEKSVMVTGEKWKRSALKRERHCCWSLVKGNSSSFFELILLKWLPHSMPKHWLALKWAEMRRSRSHTLVGIVPEKDKENGAQNGSNWIPKQTIFFHLSQLDFYHHWNMKANFIIGSSIFPSNEFLMLQSGWNNSSIDVLFFFRSFNKIKSLGAFLLEAQNVDSCLWYKDLRLKCSIFG